MVDRVTCIESGSEEVGAARNSVGFLGEFVDNDAGTGSELPCMALNRWRANVVLLPVIIRQQAPS